jgi:hypothetical protein
VGASTIETRIRRLERQRGLAAAGLRVVVDQDSCALDPRNQSVCLRRDDGGLTVVLTGDDAALL